MLQAISVPRRQHAGRPRLIACRAELALCIRQQKGAYANKKLVWGKRVHVQVFTRSTRQKGHLERHVIQVWREYWWVGVKLVLKLNLVRAEDSPLSNLMN